MIQNQRECELIAYVLDNVVDVAYEK